MTLTALIIGFAVTALLAMAYHRVYTTRSVDLDDLARSERIVEEELERELPVEHDEAEADETEPESEDHSRNQVSR